MSRSSVFGAVLFADEAAYGENVAGIGNYDARLATLGPVDASGLMQEKVDAQRTVGDMSDYTTPIRGVMGGGFKTKIWLPGHGAPGTGAVTADDHETYLGYVFGNTDATSVGTTVNSGAATTTSLPVALASGIPAGAIITVGVKGDGGGDGQPTVVGDHSGSVITLLTALPAAPANGAVVYAGVMNFPWETVTSAQLKSLRHALLSANLNYETHGNVPRSVQLGGFMPGEFPFAEIDWASAWHLDSAITLAQGLGVAVDTHNPAPIAGGSLFIQQRGTTTRATHKFRSLSIGVDLGVMVKPGPEGVHEFQRDVDAVRGPQVFTLECVIDSQDVSATPSLVTPWDSDTTDYHILLGWNGGSAGRRGAIYFPNMCRVGPRPVQFANNNINALRLAFRGKTGPTATSQLTKSAMRIGHL